MSEYDFDFDELEQILAHHLGCWPTDSGRCGRHMDRWWTCPYLTDALSDVQEWVESQPIPVVIFDGQPDEDMTECERRPYECEWSEETVSNNPDDVKIVCIAHEGEK